MVSDAQKRASAKYQKEKMVQRSIKFSPNEKDILDYLDSQDNKAGFIKELIRQSMEREQKMNEQYPRNYKFVSADGKNVEVRISGDYSDEPSRDWDVFVGDEQTYIERDDGSEVVDFIEEHAELGDNQRRFVENMITTVMAYNEWTYEQLLNSQAELENK